jgi:WD40 repeat protein
MPRPRPPSRIDTVTTPLFGICWYGNPGDGTSIVAYCGGGGSAATGVKNFIGVRIPGQEPLQITTGDQVGVALTIVQSPVNGKLYLFVALGTKVHRYSLPDGQDTGQLEAGDNLNCLSVNAMVDQLAVGCENGTVKIFNINDQELGELPLYTCEGHEKAVCAVAFSLREHTMVSSAKDGTARVWKNGNLIGVLACSIKDPKAKVPPPKRPPQALVRGCAFGDLDGRIIYTVVSGRRGKAYLSRWGWKGDKYECLIRSECSPCPISAMSLSGDAGLLALGAVDGTIILWGIERWKPMKSFREVHDLPVTCIAARPFPVPLQGEEDGIQYHALSASADSQLAYLTLQRRAPREKSSSRSYQSLINSLVRIAILAWVLYPVTNEIWDKCEDEWDSQGLAKTWECIRYDVLIAPSTRPGVLVPPY